MMTVRGQVSGVNMVFAHDTEVSLAMVAALINTSGDGAPDGDTLATQDDLDRFVRRWEITSSRGHDDAELNAVRGLRQELRRIWTAGDMDAVVDGVNALLAAAPALPQLVRHDHWDWHLHATTPDQPLATRIAVEAAMALVDVVRDHQLDRLRVCAADDCLDVHVDLSRNRSRRYCDVSCGNRLNVAAYRARKAGDDPPAQAAGTTPGG